MRSVVSVLPLSLSPSLCVLYSLVREGVCLPIVKCWLSAAAPELWVRREQGCKLLAINREQGGI